MQHYYNQFFRALHGNPAYLKGGHSMAFGRRNQVEEEIKTEETEIWACSSDDCKGWMRDNFKSEETPKCPLCNADMQKSKKVLQVVDNPHPTMKSS
jgi:hypothetical protein